jgi:hypothetical protein
MQLLRLPVVIISAQHCCGSNAPRLCEYCASGTTVSPGRAHGYDPSPANRCLQGVSKGRWLSKRIADVSVTQIWRLAWSNVQTAPDLNKEQKRAAFHGLAAALNRMGINAADMAVKAPVYKAPPPPPPPVAECWGCLLFALAAIGGAICAVECPGDGELIPVSP